MRLMGMHLEKLDLNLLVAIDALLRTQSVTETAKELNLTQSAVSSALKRARAHFDDEILYYDGQKMCPSPFGLTIAGIVPDMVTSLRALSRMRAVAELSSIKRQFTVLASDYVSAVYLSVLSKELSAIAPGISLAVVPFSEEASDWFARGKIDFLIGPAFALQDSFQRTPLFEDGFQCVLCKDSLAAQKGLSLERFLEAPHIVTNFFVGNGKSHVENWFAEQGFDISIAATLPSFVVLPHYIAGTPNIATIHNRLLQQIGPRDDLVVVDPPFVVPTLTEFLIWQDHQQYDTEAVQMRDAMLAVGQRLRNSKPSYHS